MWTHLLLFTLLPCLINSKRSSRATDAVDLSSIKSLTFHADRSTTHRRVSALPQLNCVGGSGCAHFNPTSIRCTNAGSSYSTADVEWTCTAALPPEVKLGSTDVVCEGYDSAEDEKVLKGSCALEYRLLLTEAGEARFGRSSKSGRLDSTTRQDSNIPTILFWTVFIAVAAFIVRAALRGNTPTGQNPRRAPTGPTPYNGNDDDDPPPPYSAQPKKTSTRAPRSAPAPRAARQQGPGFWQGLMGGAAAGAGAGYLAGRRGTTQTRQQPQQEQRNERSWFAPRDMNEGAGPSYTGGRYAGGGSVSSDRYESTGFGGTRRR